MARTLSKEGICGAEDNDTRGEEGDAEAFRLTEERAARLGTGLETLLDVRDGSLVRGPIS